MARGISLGLAICTMLVGSVFPFLLGLRATGLNQTILLLVMVGVAGAFIHGVGFQLRGRAAGLASPWLTWPLILLGLGAMLALR